MTEYVLKMAEEKARKHDMGDYVFFYRLSPIYTDKVEVARKFHSATEASLYAVEHNITGVEIVPV